MQQLWQRYQQAVLYIFFGVLSTLVNLLVYFLCREWLSFSVVVSNGCAWFMAVAFAYITNRIYVFHSQAKTSRSLLREITLFYGCRVFSGLVETLLLWLLIERLLFPEVMVKVFTNILVVVLNYIFSKWWIFRSKQEGAA